MKKWKIVSQFKTQKSEFLHDEIIEMILKNRGIETKKERDAFIQPPNPYLLTATDVHIDPEQLEKAILRITKAIHEKESIVVYSDYDADGITGGTIMWETLHMLGARVMPHVPHRVDEGYGLSLKGIDNVKTLHNPSLIITVDHGITAWEKIEYAKKLGIEVIVTDHHVKPEKVPDCVTVHTTTICGAGVSWFVAKTLLESLHSSANSKQQKSELLALAAIGTIADMVPLHGPNRSIAKYGLEALNTSERPGLVELISESGLQKGQISTYHVSHMLAPRLNAMGRLVHALDAVRLLCTSNTEKAKEWALLLGSTNKDRQQLTMDTTVHAIEYVEDQIKNHNQQKLLFVSHTDYNMGVIGLVAGKLVERYYRPAIVVMKGETYSKASARSIAGFNIIEAIRSASDLLVDAGGHPMAAGFTVETTKLELLKQKLEELAEERITEEQLLRMLSIDMAIPLSLVSLRLFEALQRLEPFGVGNPTPVFMTSEVTVEDVRLIGREGKHIKILVSQDDAHVETVGFGMGDMYSQLSPQQKIDIAYSLDKNTWNGNEKLQLKLKDLHIL